MNKLKEIIFSFLYIVFLTLIVCVIVFVPIWIIKSFGWILAIPPFWVFSFLFGVFIIFITYGFTERIFGSLKSDIFELTHFELVGYLFGFVLVFASITWFFLPQRTINILPAPHLLFGYFLISVPFLIGLGETLSKTVKSLLNRKVNGVFYLIITLAYFCFINLPIWFYTESLPFNYYGLGKLFFVIIIVFQILYVVFFHTIPTLYAFRQDAQNKS